MPSLGSKKDVVKRDMNFFAEFTANAAKMTRLLGYGVVAGVVVVLAIVAIIVYLVIRNAIVSATINELKNTLASEEYAGLEVRASQLQQELNDKNNYYYVLSQMREQVDMTDAVAVKLTDKLAECIPSDTYVENYLINQTSFQIDGYSFSYYSVLNLVNMLNSSDVFAAPVAITINRVAPNTVGSVDDFINNGINNYYSYKIEGQLTSDVYVSVSRYIKPAQDSGAAITSLGAIETESYSAGESYVIEDIATYSQSGVNYNLVGITVNNGALLADQVNAAIENNRIEGQANANVTIQLYYSVAEGGQ